MFTTFCSYVDSSRAQASGYQGGGGSRRLRHGRWPDDFGFSIEKNTLMTYRFFFLHRLALALKQIICWSSVENIKECLGGAVN